MIIGILCDLSGKSLNHYTFANYHSNKYWVLELIVYTDGVFSQLNTTSTLTTSVTRLRM